MTQRSYYWEGLINGDATLAPYEDFTYMNNWQKLFTREDNQGVLRSYLNELVVSGVGGGVSVDTGFGISNGWVYENTASLTKTISTPTANPRIDVVVARMTFVDGEIRIFVIEGTEDASPTAPSIIQNNNVVWDIPLAEVLIDTTGVITVTDIREYATTPLAEQPTMVLIEEIVSVSAGVTVDFTFDNIPQIYNDLILIGQWRGNSIALLAPIYFNDDVITPGNYWLQVLNSLDAAVISQAAQSPVALTVDEAALEPEEAISFRIQIPNYRGPFYKNVIQDETALNGVFGTSLSSDGGVWENTDPITKIQIADPTGTILQNSKISLYGV